MNFKETEISGAYFIEPNKFEDFRGFFARSYCKKEFKERGISFSPVQANIGYSNKKYTLRGLHYQVKPHQEAKLVRCVKGKIYDVIVDLRSESPTFKKWQGIELKADNHTMVYVPEGCAHGYQTLEDNTEICYMVSAFYEPEAERGIRWNDTEFGIKWKKPDRIIISKKDQSWADFSEM